MTSTRAERYRLVTRSDFDGLVCAALLKHLGILDDILFVHPEGRAGRQGRDRPQRRHDEPAVQRARGDLLRSPQLRGHARRRPAREPRDRPGRPVRRARGLRLLRRRRRLPRHRGADGRRGQGRRRPVQPRRDPAPHRLGDAQLPDGPAHRPRPLPRVRDLQLPADDAADRHLVAMSIEEIFENPHVKERVELYNAHAAAAEEQIRRCATVHGNLVVLDLRDEEVIHPTNRFTLYALFPQCNISIHALWGLRQQNTVFATGKSIIDRGSKTNVGELMLRYGGGGHDAAGTCQVENEDAARVLRRAGSQPRSTPTGSLRRRERRRRPSRQDPVMAGLIDAFGGPLPEESAEAARRRLQRAAALDHRPAALGQGRAGDLRAPDRALRRPRRRRPRSCSPTTRRRCAPPPGLSRAKIVALRSLAEHVLAGELQIAGSTSCPTRRSCASSSPSRASASGRRTCS